MVIIKNSKKVFLNQIDEKSLKMILDYYLWNVSDNWDDELAETSVILRINELLGN